jgi:hypothetical protein
MAAVVAPLRVRAAAVQLPMQVAVEVVEVRTAVVAAVTLIAKVRTFCGFSEGPPLFIETGLSTCWPCQRKKNGSTTLSALSCLTSSSSPGISKFGKAIGHNSGYLSESAIV